MRPSETPETSIITRREAIRRAALVAGVALSPEWLGLVGCAKNAAVKTYLEAAQGATLAAAADRIIPRTDTPGAADVGVAAVHRSPLRRVHDAGRAAAAHAGIAGDRDRGKISARLGILNAQRYSAGRRAARGRHRPAGPGSKLVRLDPVGDDSWLLHLRAGRQERAALRSRAWRLQQLRADRPGGAAQLDDLTGCRTGPAPLRVAPGQRALRPRTNPTFVRTGMSKLDRWLRQSSDGRETRPAGGCTP